MREHERASASAVATTTTTSTTAATAAAAASVCSSWCRITAPSPRLAPSCSPAPKLSVITVIGPINRLARAAPLATSPFPLPSLSKLHRFAYSLFSLSLSLYIYICFSFSIRRFSPSLFLSVSLPLIRYNDAHPRQRVPTPTRSTR